MPKRIEVSRTACYVNFRLEHRDVLHSCTINQWEIHNIVAELADKYGVPLNLIADLQDRVRSEAILMEQNN